jgi:hypothetical protein
MALGGARAEPEPDDKDSGQERHRNSQTAAKRQASHQELRQKKNCGCITHGAGVRRNVLGSCRQYPQEVLEQEISYYIEGANIWQPFADASCCCNRSLPPTGMKVGTGDPTRLALLASQSKSALYIYQTPPALPLHNKAPPASQKRAPAACPCRAAPLAETHTPQLPPSRRRLSSARSMAVSWPTPPSTSLFSCARLTR